MAKPQHSQPTMEAAQNSPNRAPALNATSDIQSIEVTANGDTTVAMVLSSMVK